MKDMISADLPNMQESEPEIRREELERAFKARLKEAIRASVKECRYTPHAFMDMIAKHGAIEAARMLLHTRAISDGFMKLWEMRRLDLTVEWIIVREPEWAEPFTREEQRIARQRLDEYEKTANPWRLTVAPGEP
ncbi:MAG: hypothetical protein ABSG38_02150 [Spirochaetia bacterium]